MTASLQRRFLVSRTVCFVAMFKPGILASVAGALLLIAGCGGNGDKQAAVGGCKTVTAAASPRQVEPRKAPTQKLNARKTYVAKVQTSEGAFEIALDAKASPKTSASFVALAKECFYNGLTFHRIAQGFVIQGGDPAGDGSGGPGYSVRERPSKSATYTQGIVAMAKTGANPPGTSGSQFFVVTGADAGLPPDYAILGKVTEGLDAVEKIDALGQPGADGPPSKPVVIERVDVETS